MASKKTARELVARFLEGETIEATVESVEAGELGWLVKCREGVWLVLGDAPIPGVDEKITTSADVVEAGEGALLNGEKAQLWYGPSVRKEDVIKMERRILREREERGVEKAERMGQLLEEVANEIRGYLRMGEIVSPDNAAFGFGEAKRIMREQMEKIDEAMQP